MRAAARRRCSRPSAESTSSSCSRSRWALAGFAGALAGHLYANNVRLDPSTRRARLKAFAVALVGGLDSLGGVIPGA
jgi:branched-subunit amino acid ABC-type transport system permease component